MVAVVGQRVLFQQLKHRSEIIVPMDEFRNTAAMKMFVDRLVTGTQISTDPPIIPSSLLSSSLSYKPNMPVVAPMNYRICYISKTCHILSWEKTLIAIPALVWVYGMDCWRIVHTTTTKQTTTHCGASLVLAVPHHKMIHRAFFRNPGTILKIWIIVTTATMTIMFKNK